MQMRKFVGVVVCSLFLVTAAASQEVLEITADSPQIDGIVSDGEYSMAVELPEGVLYLNRTAELLCVAVQSELDGWVSVGLGSKRMDAASIYIGYVDSGEQVFAKQLGRGHGHEDSSVAEPTAFQLKENQTGTVLELSFPASAFIPAGATSLSLIVAGGRRDNLTSYHTMRRGLEIRL